MIKENKSKEQEVPRSFFHIFHRYQMDKAFCSNNAFSSIKEGRIPNNDSIGLTSFIPTGLATYLGQS